MVITVLVCTHLTGEIRSVKDPGTTILVSFPDTCFFSLPDSSTPSSPASVFLPRSGGVTHLKIWTQRSLPECPPFARPVLPLLPVRPANRVPRQPRCTPGHSVHLPQRDDRFLVLVFSCFHRDRIYVITHPSRHASRFAPAPRGPRGPPAPRRPLGSPPLRRLFPLLGLER